jgi:hypothetical protein
MVSYQAWTSAAGLTSGPLFRKLNRTRRPTARAVSPAYVARLVKRAAARGLGPHRRDELEIVGDGVAALRRQFTVDRKNLAETDQTRRQVAAQALLYRERAGDYLRDYRGQVVALAGGQVIGAAATVDEFAPRARLDGGRNLGGIYLKKALPAPEEAEHLEVYEEIAGA